jgi:hypothetical protein
MSNTPIPIPADATVGFDQQLSQSQQPQPQPSQPTGTGAPIPAGATVGFPEQTTAQTATPEGEQTNDVGNTVIVPKEGESFSGTMKRAAVQGKKTTPEQIQAEVKTMPAKVAQVLTAAPAIGAVGAAGLAVTGAAGAELRSIPNVANALLEHAEAHTAEWAAKYPTLMKLGLSLGIPTTTTALLGWLIHSAKGQK